MTVLLQQGLGHSPCKSTAFEEHLSLVLALLRVMLLPHYFVPPQASDAMSRHEGDADAAEEALTALSAGFELEEATSRRSTAAPPSAYLMAGALLPTRHSQALPGMLSRRPLGCRAGPCAFQQSSLEATYLATAWLLDARQLH